MASTTSTSPTVTVTAVEATEAGALDGYSIDCTCGYRQRCSLPTLAAQWAIDHTSWHAVQALRNRQGR